MNKDEFANENGVLQQFDVKISETLEKMVTVVAADQLDAELIVNDAWNNGEHILDADHFTGVKFEAKPTGYILTQDVEPYEKGDNHDMNGDNKGISQDARSSEPLAENQYVQELFSALQDNGRDTAGLAALLVHVSEMESFVKRAEDTISVMKSQLDEMKEVQDHPVRATLQNTIKALEKKVAEIRERLSGLKDNIVGGCKNAVAAFKEKGAAALDKLASFFRIKGGLQGLKKNVESGIRIDDKAIAKIESFANEYHSAGRALKNMARIAVGKEPLDSKKEAGKLAKTIAAPYRAQKAALMRLNKTIDQAITKLGQLENSVSPKEAERTAAKKPSLLGQLQKNVEAVEQAKREHRVHEQAVRKGTEL